MGQGRSSFFGWGQESTWGTAVTPTKFAEIKDDNFKAVRDQVARPVFRDLDPREGNLYDRLFGGGGGGIFEGNYEGMLRLFEHAFGDSSGVTTGPVGSVYTHTFTLKDTLMSGKGLSFHINTDTDSAGLPQKRFFGFKINELGLEFDPQANLAVTVQGVAKDMDKVAASTPTFPGIANYIAGHQCSCEIDDVATLIKSAKISLNNGMQLDGRQLGSKNIREPVRDVRRAVTGQIVVDAAESWLTKYLAGTLFKLELLHLGPVLGGGNYRFDVTALKCRITDDPYQVKTPGLIEATVPFEILKPTSGELLTIAFQNSETAIA